MECRNNFIINNITYTYIINNINIRIIDSYKIIKRKDMKSAIKQIRKQAASKGFIYKRNNKEWVQEWRAHNLLYVLNYEIDRTKSVDLNEDESKSRKILYKILSFIYNFIH
jgi:frataxin-like iron-binding protein CyaY